MSARVRSPLSARARLWLLFGGLALATAGLLAGGVGLSARWLLPAPLYWLAAGLALVTLQALIWLLLDRTWLQPSTALAREIRLLLHADAERPIAVPESHGLGELVPAIAARFGVTLSQRHQALGDAVATGQVFLRLLELLEAQGVRTLGDALAVSERAVEVRRRQAAQFGPPRERGLRRAGRA